MAYYHYSTCCSELFMYAASLSSAEPYFVWHCFIRQIILLLFVYINMTRHLEFLKSKYPQRRNILNTKDTAEFSIGIHVRSSFI